MKKENDPFMQRRRPRPADHVVVLLVSVGISCVVLLLGISAGRLAELVLGLITAFAVVTINVLFACSQWDDKGGAMQQENEKLDRMAPGPMRER